MDNITPVSGEDLRVEVFQRRMRVITGDNCRRAATFQKDWDANAVQKFRESKKAFASSINQTSASHNRRIFTSIDITK